MAALPALLSVLAAWSAAGAAPQEAAPQAEPGGAGSYLTRPLYLDEEPPECRAAERLRLAPRPGEGPDELFARAAELARRWAAGEDPRALAAEEPATLLHETLGSFAPGLLRPELEAFLWSAEPGAVSAPLPSEAGLDVARRVPRWAGCRVIFLRGEDAAERAREVLAALEAGADFAALARERSDDAESAARGGAWAVFERGPRDAALKEATFRAAPGAVFGPLASAAGLLVGRRVAPESLPRELWEEPWIRARAIFLAHRDAAGPRQLAERSLEEAAALARELHGRLAAGADMAELARRHDDDLGGRARAGDLGWLHRAGPTRAGALDPLFSVPPGTLLDPLPVEAGWLLLRRER